MSEHTQTSSNPRRLNDQPPRVDVDFDAIHPELQALNQWILWRYELDKKGRWTKVPYQSKYPTGLASTTRQGTWASFNDTRTAFNNTPDVDGIGFVFSENDPYAGIDFDNKLDPETGEIDPLTSDRLQALNSYTETSPSGKGFHVIVRATVGAGKNNRDHGVEMYDKERFFTFTGHTTHTPEIIPNRQTELNHIYNEVWPNEKTPTTAPQETAGATTEPTEATNPLHIISVLKSVLRSPTASKFRNLHKGNDTDYANDASSADLAYCGFLHYHGATPDQIDTLIRNSPRHRPKWDEKRGSDTYGSRTIKKAQEGTRKADAGTITTNPTPSKNKHHDLDQLMRPQARSPITIQSGGYASVKDTKEGPAYTQLTNWTFTPTLALIWPDGTTGHRGTLTINNHTTHTIDLPATAWAGRRDLLTHVAAYDAVIFANSNSDIAHIRQFILTNHNQLPTARGVTTYGLHNLNGKWTALFQDTHHENIFYSGVPHAPNDAAFTELPIGTPEQLEQARHTITAYPHLITPTTAMAMLGYAMASAYAPRITPLIGNRLPFLYIAGERESGKSSSIELLLELTTGSTTARIRKAAGLTPYQYDISFSDVNNRLAALDEYRPGEIDDAQLRKHHDLGQKWRGTGMGNHDLVWNLNSPLIVSGEGFTEDAAALSRGPLMFIAKQDRGDSKNYLTIHQAPNWAYAHHLQETARTLPEQDHLNRFQHAGDLARQATNTKGGPRLQFALTWIAYGLLHLQDDGFTFVTDPAILRTLTASVEQTLDGGEESQTNLEKFLEQLGSLTSELKDPGAILIPGAETDTIIIRISPAVELVKRRYGKNAAITNTTALRKYGQNLEWVNTNEKHRDALSTLVRGIKIDLALAPARTDLSALAYLDQAMRHEMTR